MWKGWRGFWGDIHFFPLRLERWRKWGSDGENIKIIPYLTVFVVSNFFSVTSPWCEQPLCEYPLGVFKRFRLNQSKISEFLKSIQKVIFFWKTELRGKIRKISYSTVFMISKKEKIWIFNGFFSKSYLIWLIFEIFLWNNEKFSWNLI